MTDEKKKKSKTQDDELNDLLKKAQEEDDLKSEQEESELNAEKLESEEIAKYKDQALRANAELQNVKRRMEKDRQDFIKYASSGLLKKLLPILDNFERAFAALPKEIKDHEWVKGIAQIEKTFVDVLNKEDLVKIEPKKGEEFNTDLHEAIMQDATQKEGIIGDCLEKGYQVKAKVLRPAKVSVGNK